MWLNVYAIWKGILKAIQMNSQWIIVESNPQLVVNSTNEKTEMSKEIINLIGDIWVLISSFHDLIIEDCYRLISTYADRMAIYADL